jgi:glycosyltransferase involved in cell wall biosynthesis
MKIGVMLRAIDEEQGIGIYTQNLMDHLLPLDKKNEYVLFYQNPKFLGRYARYEHVREKLLETRLSPPIGGTPPSLYLSAHKVIWDQVKIPIEAKREGVDLIFNPKFSVPLSMKCRTIMVLHGSEWFVYPKNYKLLDRIYVRIMMPLYCKKASFLISNSDLSKRDFVNIVGVSEDKIKTIYFGVDPRFRHIDDDIFLKKAREKYQLPEKFILFVGKIYPGKNFGNLIRAFSKIHTSLPQKIVVAGHPRHNYQKEYASIEKLGLQEKILFSGWVPHEDLVAFYNLADLFILPSFYDSFGIPVLEAMACGCPVIASKTGALPEIAGGAALLIDPHNPDEIAGAIRKVLIEDELRKELIEKGMSRAKAFSWEKCARETLTVFESLNDVMHSD